MPGISDTSVMQVWGEVSVICQIITYVATKASQQLPAQTDARLVHADGESPEQTELVGSISHVDATVDPVVQ